MKDSKKSGVKNAARAWRELSELNVIDDFLARELLSGPDRVAIANILLSVFLGREVRVTDVAIQMPLQGISPENRGIGLDILAEEGEGGSSVVYNTEMECLFELRKEQQAASLPRRARYHQSLIDAREVKRGTMFLEIPDVVTVFVTDFDPFGKGEMRYEARTAISGHPELGYDDGLRKIFLYTDGEPGEHGMETLRNMLRYIRHSAPSNAVDGPTKELDRMVQKVKRNEEVTTRYMTEIERTYFMTESARDEGREEGRREGREEGLEEGRKEGQEKGAEEARLESIRNVMEALGYTAEKAMEILKIPADQRDAYKGKVSEP